MNFSFNFGWPPFLGGLFGVLINVALVVSGIVAVILLVRRLIVVWRDWGHPPELGLFASRAQLLDEGMQVVGLREGIKVAKANDVILDLSTGCVAGFRVRASWRKRLLPFDKVKGIGRDAITVESAADLLAPDPTLALARLATNKHRWQQSEVVTEGGSRLGTTSWRRLWYDRTNGAVELSVETSYHSLVNALLAIVIELASVFQPVSNWVSHPGRFSVRVPLRMVRSANRKMVILNAEGEARFHEAIQAEASRTREGINASYHKLRNFVQRGKTNWPLQSPAQEPDPEVQRTK
jgi:sporulation protein YlmC with PRC-barrel domain